MVNIYVQNTHPNHVSIKCEYPSTSKGDTQFGKPKTKHIVFRPETIDTITGNMVETGYTMLLPEVYEALTSQHTGLFNHAVKSGWLTVSDQIPESAQTPTSLLIAEKQKVADLTAKVAELEGQVAALNGKIEELSKKSQKAAKQEEVISVQEAGRL